MVNRDVASYTVRDIYTSYNEGHMTEEEKVQSTYFQKNRMLCMKEEKERLIQKSNRGLYNEVPSIRCNFILEPALAKLCYLCDGQERRMTAIAYGN